MTSFVRQRLSPDYDCKWGYWNYCWESSCWREKLTNLSNLVKHENAQNWSAILPGEDSNAKQCWAIETVCRLVTRDKRWLPLGSLLIHISMWQSNNYYSHLDWEITTMSIVYSLTSGIRQTRHQVFEET